MKDLENVTTSNEEVLTDLGNLMGDLQTVLTPADSKEGGLAKAWHYLQVYSRWGQRLPHTDDKLQSALNITHAMPNKFYSLMLAGYKEIYDATGFFEKSILTKIDDLNKTLLRYAEKGKQGEYELIVEMVDAAKKSEDREEALKAVLDLVKDLQIKALENEAQAKEVKDSLFKYSGMLIAAEATVSQAQEAVEKDDEVSKSRINNLKGSEELDGSIANFRSLMEDLEEEYKFNVTVAATTPTYGWVPFIGWLSSAVVAGVYGDRAVKTLKKLNEMKGKWEAANKELIYVLNIHSTQSLANEGLTKAKFFTQNAINNTEIVKKAWSDLSNNLTTILEKVEGMTSTNSDSEKELRAGMIVKNFAKTAAEKWMEIEPVIKAMNNSFFITFEEGEKSISSLLAEIEMSLDDRKN